MAPEQASGKKAADRRRRRLCLGAILYDLLTGRPPFHAETPLDTLLQVLEQEPAPPRQLNREVRSDLETMCLKCLQKGAGEALRVGRGPGGRPGALAPWRADPGAAGGIAGSAWRWCRRNPAVAGLSAGLALALLAVTAISIALAVRRGQFAAVERQGRQQAEQAPRTSWRRRRP